MNPPSRRSLRARLGVRAAALATAAVAAAGLAAVPAVTSSAQAATASRNPLVGTSGVYTGPADEVYAAWQRATGTDKKLLAEVALQPRVRWFGQWIPNDKLAAKLHDYISVTQHGNPATIVQLAIFRLWPRTEAHARDPLTAADQQAYRTWIDIAARAIGSTRTAMVLEPDLGVALTGWRPAVRLALAAYAARKFSALPRTSVYLDASSSDWLKVPAAVSMLRRAGIRYAHGFALNATHYDSTANNLVYGGQVSAALAKAGLPGKRFVINTADTGKPFTWPQYWAMHPHGDFNNAEACQTRTQVHCVTLGIPPRTTDLADARFHFGGRAVTAARTVCDGYLWFGRPWYDEQGGPFDLRRTLTIARTTPWQRP